MNFKYNKVKKVGYVTSFVVALKLWIKKGIYFFWLVVSHVIYLMADYKENVSSFQVVCIYSFFFPNLILSGDNHVLVLHAYIKKENKPW